MSDTIDVLNATDRILLRRLVVAVEAASAYSAASLTEAKLLASILAERIGMNTASVTALVEVAA